MLNNFFDYTRINILIFYLIYLSPNIYAQILIAPLHIPISLDKYFNTFMSYIRILNKYFNVFMSNPTN